MLNKAMKMSIYVEITTKWPINPDFSSQRWCRIKQIDIINNGQYICKSKKDYFNTIKSRIHPLFLNFELSNFDFLFSEPYLFVIADNHDFILKLNSKKDVNFFINKKTNSANLIFKVLN